MRNKFLLIPVSLLIIALVAASTTNADVSHDPAMPAAILHDQSFDFALVGNRAGAFAYYSLEYPGDGSVITIELDMAPGDPVAVQGLGFNVYGKNGFLIGSGTIALGIPDRKALLWADPNPGPWLIQVYNYLDGVVANLHLEVTGLPDPPPAPQPVMLPAQATTFSMAAASLLGNHAGNFHYYKIESVGDGSEVVLQLYHTPDDQWISNGFGLNVYSPEKGIRAAQASHEARFRRDSPGTYLVQVYNYVHAINVTYLLTLTPN